jgi:hypothetical protein
VRRAYLIASLAVVAAAAALVMPAAAFAGTYTWNMPGDFTTTGNGSNPDHDQYGAKPWSYVEGPAVGLTVPSLTPSTFTPLPNFATNIASALTGWYDPQAANAFVAENTGSSNSGAVPPGQLALNPAANHVVALQWTSPLNRSVTISITGTLTADDAACLGTGPVWSLNEGTTSLASGAGSGSISGLQATVPAGGTIDLVLGYSGALQLNYANGCYTTGATLQISTNQSTAPAPTLDSPANGAVISGGQPTFSGKADTSFGTSSQVTVKVYSGPTATGTPLRTLHTARGSDGGYSVPIDAPLPDGLYTAQTEQSNLASPPDTGASRPTTFTVHNAPPTITLASLGSKPLLTATPTFTGKAGTAPGDSSNVALLIYPGSNTKQTPVRFITATRDANGHFSIKVVPALADGEYTALVAQNGSTKVGTSNTQTFRIKVHPPALTLTSPAAGAHTSNQSPTVSGTAGNALGDSSQVTVILYAGSHLKGKPLGTVHVTRAGSTWTVDWPKPLKLGFYTVIAKQSDDAGHTTTTPSHTFQIVPGPSAIGKSVTLARRGAPMAAVSVTCLAPATETCSGNVLVLTSKSYRPVASGPSGQLRVLFSYVTVTGGKTVLVRQQVSSEVARVLRRHAPLGVTITASLSTGSGSPLRYSAARTLRLGS